MASSSRARTPHLRRSASISQARRTLARSRALFDCVEPLTARRDLDCAEKRRLALTRGRRLPASGAFRWLGRCGSSVSGRQLDRNELIGGLGVARDRCWIERTKAMILPLGVRAGSGIRPNRNPGTSGAAIRYSGGPSAGIEPAVIHAHASAGRGRPSGRNRQRQTRASGLVWALAPLAGGPCAGLRIPDASDRCGASTVGNGSAGRKLLIRSSRTTAARFPGSGHCATSRSRRSSRRRPKDRRRCTPESPARFEPAQLRSRCRIVDRPDDRHAGAAHGGESFPVGCKRDVGRFLRHSQDGDEVECDRCPRARSARFPRSPAGFPGG